jgi:hypothetical protein
MRNILLRANAVIDLNESKGKAQENRTIREDRVSHARQLLPNPLRHLAGHVDKTLMCLGSALAVATVSASLGFGAEILFVSQTPLSDSELRARILVFTAKKSRIL